MAGVYKRGVDRLRGKAGRWTCWYRDEGGKRRSFVGSTDKAASLDLAQHRETECRMVREGLVDPLDRQRRESSLREITVHIEDYRTALLAKGGTIRHAGHVAGVLTRLLESATIATVADLAPDRIAEALGRLKVTRSARTVNHAAGAVKAFARWLHDVNRIKEVPRGLVSIGLQNEAADRKRTRRALTADELTRLYVAAEQGPERVATRAKRGGAVTGRITGPERAILYRLAAGTGFRADELRTLTPDRFALDGDAPTVTVLACYSKNGKQAVQPIARELADLVRPFVAGKEPGKPFLAVPVRTSDMLEADLIAAGVPFETAEGIADFHALRHTFISRLVAAGVNIKVVQILARHSDPSLTLRIYSHAVAADVRRALEGGE